MKNENRMLSDEEKQAWFARYNEGMHRAGRIWTLFTLAVLLAVPFVMGMILGAMPDMNRFLRGFINVAIIYYPTSVIEYLIYVAQNQLGKPYSYDANPPKTFDCALYTHYCYDMINKGDIKSSAKTQGYDDRQPKLSYSELKRGDLVCFNTNSSDDDLSDHVGIYLGKGYFIHASSGGGMVMVSSMSSGYYKRVFSWGRRMIG